MKPGQHYTGVLCLKGVPFWAPGIIKVSFFQNLVCERFLILQNLLCEKVRGPDLERSIPV